MSDQQVVPTAKNVSFPVTKRKKECKDIKTKYRVICTVEEAEKKSKKETAKVRKEMIKEYGLPDNSIITKWMNKKDKIKAAYFEKKPSTKTIKEGKFPEMEKELLDWINKQEKLKVPLSNVLIRMKASGIAERMNIPSSRFKSSYGWFSKFCSQTDQDNRSLSSNF